MAQEKSQITPDVLVIGGGIVGVSIAHRLQQRGVKVEMLTRDAPGEGGASDGNCGILAAGEIVPLSKPGILSKVPGWLLDPKGPLFIRANQIFPALPWLAQFTMASRDATVRRIAGALATLTQNSIADYKALEAEIGIDDLVRANVPLFVYSSEAARAKDCFAWDLRRELGFDHDELTGDELRNLEPDLGPGAGAAIRANGWQHTASPLELTQAIARAFISAGGVITQESVAALNCEGNHLTGVTLANGAVRKASSVVLAAGSWSGHLLRTAGRKAPVAPLFGYHSDLPSSGLNLTHPVIYPEGGLTMTPMKTGLRVGGTIEIAAHGSAPDWQRADVLVERAAEITPKINGANPKRWRGARPFMPDTMPVLGPDPKLGNLFHAFGHGQLGVTLAPTTANLITDCVLGHQPQADLSPFTIARY